MLEAEILEDVKLNPCSLQTVIQKYSEKNKFLDVIGTVRKLFIEDKIKKTRKNGTILLSYRNADEEVLYNDIDENIASSSKSISRLARKFRSCRYSVERDIETKNKLFYSLKVSKDKSDYYILFVSDTDYFNKKDVFAKMLKNDDTIRIVTENEEIKVVIVKKFDNFIMNTYGKNGYDDFYKKHGFSILTIDEFFKKTTWKTLVS